MDALSRVSRMGLSYNNLFMVYPMEEDGWICFASIARTPSEGLIGRAIEERVWTLCVGSTARVYRVVECTVSNPE